MNLFALTPVGILESKSKEKITNIFPSLLSKIKYDIKTYIPEEASRIAEEQGVRADGAYDEENKILYLHSLSTMRTALHEIGHAVHYQLLGCKDFSLPEEGQTDRAKLNYKEDFAEAFASLFLNEDRNYTNRDYKIKEIIESVI